MPNSRHAASQPAITTTPTTTGGAMSPILLLPADRVMPFAAAPYRRRLSRSYFEVFYELRRERLGPIGVLRQQIRGDHQIVGGLEALFGDDADALRLGVAAVEHFKLVEALDAEG